MSKRDPFDTCWSCDTPLNGYAFFCPACRIVQPPHGDNAFEMLGIGELFEVEFLEVDEEYFRRQTELHPDRFVNKSEVERLYSAQQSAALNEAYETIKDPLKRAGHLLHLMGADNPNEDGVTFQDTAILNEVMENQEELEHAKSKTKVEDLHHRAEDAVKESEEVLGKAFREKDVPTALNYTNRLKYMKKFIEACERKERQMDS